MQTKYLFLGLIFFGAKIFAQYTPTFGELNVWDTDFTTYEKDSLASAVVLFEKGDVKFKVISNSIRLVKEYHVKIKVLNSEGFDQANVSIPFYHSESSTEKISEIQAITHNDGIKTGVRKTEFFTVDLSERWKETRFTFPNVKEGSILEYRYVLRSPYFFKLENWNFQSDIPKLYSEFNAEIPGNYVYNRSIYGSLKLDVNEASVKKSCFSVPGSSRQADCEVLKYAMKDIPAFKAEEDFMLSPGNYIARIDFEISEHRRFDGVTDKYTKSWEDVDLEFRKDKDIGRQLTKKGFFEKNVPDSLFIGSDQLAKARKIYAFVQNHYSWNGKYGIYRNIRVKDAFNLRSGNVGEINISLINLLNAADIPTNLMLLSTRTNGLPKKTHPVMSDFNYVVAKTTIGGVDYLLDASEKLNPFGMLPFRCLNHYGRVMDFKNASYWYDIVPENKNKHMIRTQIKFDLEQDLVTGLIDDLSMGYSAYGKKKELQGDEDEYLSELEEAIGNEFEVTSYEVKEYPRDDKKMSERFEFNMSNPLKQNKLFLNPFLIRFFTKNPFLLEERNYPIDFGFKRNYSYQATILLPEGYEVAELPEKRIVNLNDNAGVLKLNHMVNQKQITLLFDLKLNASYFEPEHYESLKKLFEHVVEVQNNSLIVLTKAEG